jgi:hypothetical protein
VSKPAISYAPHASASPAAEISALRNVYSFVIKSSRAKRKVRGSSSTDNDEKQERRWP